MRNPVKDLEPMEYSEDLREVKRPKSFNKKKDPKSKQKGGSEYITPIRIPDTEAQTGIPEESEESQEQVENEYQALILI